MVHASKRSSGYATVLAMVALLLVVVAPPAAAASETQPANGATFNSAADWTPADPSRLFAADNFCTGSPINNSWVEVQFAAFSIPAGDTIDGIEVRVNHRSSVTHTAQLKKSGGFVGLTRTIPDFFVGPSACSSTGWVSAGGSGDLWGATWSPADFNTSGTVEVRITQNGATLDVDAVELIVHHSGANTAPTADAGGPYTVAEGGSVALDGTASSDLDGDSLTYAWDLDNDGTFDDSTSATPTFSAAGLDGAVTKTVGLVVNDGTVDSAPSYTTVQVNNVAPIITGITVSPGAIDEGQSVTVSGTFTDPAVLQETHTGTAEWSDGVFTTLTVGDGTFSTSRTFPDDHPLTATASDSFTVEITVDDGDGGSDAETSSAVTVSNVDPTITGVSLSAATIQEGDTVTVSGSFTDPALGVVTETFGGSASWSDSASTTLSVGSGTFSTSRTFLDDDPIGTSSDTFTVSIGIDDDDFGLASATSPTLTVENVAPVIGGLTVTPMIDEDGTVSLSGDFTDVGVLDTHTVSVDWGDTTSSAAAVTQGAGSGTFAATHQYLDDDPTGTPQDTYTITVTVADDDLGTDSATVATLVKNVAPVLSPPVSDATFADKAEEGETVTVSGAFTDVGTLDTHTGTVDWGDGTVTPATIVQGSGGGTYSASHAYAAGGVYTVTVEISDDDTGTTTATTTAVVTGVGVNGGVLQIVGTSGDDRVHVQPVGDEIDVYASYLSPRHRRFDAAAVSSIEIWLCEGDDQGDVHPLISLDAHIRGDAGDDMLKGGSGDDTVEGGTGEDKLWGRDGNDLLDGGPGPDKLFGGAGTNVLID